MKREVLTCDVCRRELPLRGVRGQTTRRVIRTWHFPGFRPEDSSPEHVCGECWVEMCSVARAALSMGVVG